MTFVKSSLQTQNYLDANFTLQALRYALLEKVLPKVKFEELFAVPIDKYITEFLTKCRTLPPPLSEGRDPSMLPDIQIRQDPQFRRLHSTIDVELALRRYNVFR